MSDPAAREHRASITWSRARMERGLPAEREVAALAWIDPDAPRETDGHRLVCRFESPPSEQGNPSSAMVRFDGTDAPHDRLEVGKTLRLVEGDTDQFASVSILD